MELNKAIFIDIDTCLIQTISGKSNPVLLTDWVFRKLIVNYLNKHKSYKVCLIADKPYTLIVRKSFYSKYLELIVTKFKKNINKDVEIIYYKSSDAYFHYPYPGGILNYAIENNIDLYNSIYITDNIRARTLSCIGNTFNLTDLLKYDS